MALTGLVERPDSPQRSGDGGSRKITRIYNINKSEDENLYIPEKFALKDDGYFLSYSRTSQPGYDVLAMTYTDNEDAKAGSRGTHKDGDEEWLIAQAGTMDKPLEERAGYKTIWNYNLYQYSESADTAIEAPAWQDSAEDLTDAKEREVEGADGYMWSKDRPSASTGFWILVKKHTKDSEGFLYRPMTIDHVQYFKKQARADAAYQLEPTRKLPDNTKGITGSTKDHWLCQGVQAPTFDGSLWVVINEYIYNPTQWDYELYP